EIKRFVRGFKNIKEVEIACINMEKHGILKKVSKNYKHLGRKVKKDLWTLNNTITFYSVPESIYPPKLKRTKD
ncbi:MAG TPA: hypothetical protein DIV86_03890, partial [Alphaproteobacteria bacterium]|nr:hypothetical protein [Alphaproteobacteria bacterium]